VSRARQYAHRTAAELLRYGNHVLSDEDIKEIDECTDPKELAAEILAGGPPFNEDEIRALIKVAGNMDEDTDFERDGSIWRDDVLDRYAEHLYNYEYTYKPEAQETDPSIDPEEKHTGIMAQDIEEVNPATVKETEDGVKTVDIGRTALMNAGAIAALARQNKDLNERLKRVEGGNG